MADSKPKRILGFDFARSLAIFGMVIVNFSISITNYEITSAAWAEDFSSIFYGRAAGLFVVLAGVGVSLMTKRALANQDEAALRARRVMLLKRSAILFVLGLSWIPIWAADILHFYALYFLIAVILLRASSRALWIWAALFMLIFVALVLTFDYDASWDWDTVSDFSAWTFSGFLRDLFFNGFHPVFPWAAFILMGMWFGRQEVSDPVWRRRALAISASVAVITELVSAILIRSVPPAALEVSAEELPFVLGTTPSPPLPFYIIAATATAFTIILLSIEITERYKDVFIVRALIAAGQLALTIYLAHVLIGLGIMQGLGLIENSTTEFSLYYSGAFFVAAVAFSYWWRQRHTQGPLERLLRRLSAGPSAK